MDTGTQHDIENHDAQLLIEEATHETESDNNSEDLDNGFHMSSHYESKIFENDDNADNYCNSKIKALSAIVYYWSLLRLFLQNCITYLANATIEILTRTKRISDFSSIEMSQRVHQFMEITITTTKKLKKYLRRLQLFHLYQN